MDKSIEERAKEYAPDVLNPNYTIPAYIASEQQRAYIAGATDQKAIDEEVRLKKCDDMTEAEYNRETAFADWYNKNGKGTPTFSDAIEWARKEVISKVCEWLKEQVYQEYGGGPCERLIPDTIIEEFRKAMEE